jgi:hypothetical protein
MTSKIFDEVLCPEMRVMRTYCFLGYEKLRKVPCLASAAEIVYAHCGGVCVQNVRIGSAAYFRSGFGLCAGGDFALVGYLTK